MVYNTRAEHAGMFQNLYNNDGYLYLELYHDNDDDGDTNVFSGYACWKIRSNLGVDINNYKGIKILYWNYKSKTADVCTIEALKNNNINIAQ